MNEVLSLFLSQVVVSDLKNRKWKYYFPCGQWLATDEGDGLTSRDLAGSLDPLGVRKGRRSLSLRYVTLQNLYSAYSLQINGKTMRLYVSCWDKRR